MSEKAIPTNESLEDGKISFAEFLETKPPNISVIVRDFYRSETHHSFGGPIEIVTSKTTYKFSFPDIQLHCDSPHCQGIRFFCCLNGNLPVKEEKNNVEALFLFYLCRNCKITQKKFAVVITIESTSEGLGSVVKLGEEPSFGPPTPARVISLIGPDRETFIKGRRAENQGLGIGAFAYYRRVVENQKDRLIAEISKVAKRLNANQEILDTFDKAINETQFSRAVDLIKMSIPTSLLIDGHNPLSLLHSALSEGLHARTDDECLELATSIRVILTELAERISTALKDEVELKSAVSRLLKVKNPNSQT